MTAAANREQLRALVREALREALGVGVGGVGGVGSVVGAGPATPAPALEAVRIASDADLDAFVQRLAVRCADPATRTALAEGRLRYRLDGAVASRAAAPATGPTVAPTVRDVRIDTGAVTERHVRQAAASGARLVVGVAAVLTPLARDRARTDHVEIVEERRSR